MLLLDCEAEGYLSGTKYEIVVESAVQVILSPLFKIIENGKSLHIGEPPPFK